jgi:hypothetical protein
MKNKTLLQDNVRFHHSKIVKKYTVENNIGMNYIPAYSPIFNPIEMSFYNCPIVYRPFRAYIQYWGMKN